MSGFTVIAAVTRTLAAVLNSATGVPVEDDVAPHQGVGDSTPLIHLYLYRVEPNAFLRNLDWVPGAGTTLQGPPLAVNLHYMLTPHGSGQLEIQKTLGQILQVLHDTPVIPPSAYDPALVGTTEELRIVPRPVPLETMTELWRAFEGRSYRLAVTYEVSVALIDSTRTRTVHRVEERYVHVETMR